MVQRAMSMLDKETGQNLRPNLPKSKQHKKEGGSKFLLWLVKNANKGPGDSEYDKYAY